MSKNLKIVIIILFFIILSIFLLFFSVKKDNINNNEKPIIAVAIVPQIEFVKAVAGDDFEIVTMIPPGANPENYEPTPLEKQKFEKASIYFSMGVPTEENNIIPNLSKNTKLVRLDEETRVLYEDLTFENGGRDPHIWLSPKRVIQMVQKISEELGDLNPEKSLTYWRNGVKYTDKIKILMMNCQDIVDNMDNKKFIAYHPAFQYLADDFGLDMYALEEEGKEATVDSLREKIDLAKENNIKKIFYQSEIDSSQSAAFAEEIGGEAIMLTPLAENYIENYLEMIKKIAGVN